MKTMLNKLLVLNDKEKLFTNVIIKNDDLFDYHIMKYKEHYLKYMIKTKQGDILIVDITSSFQERSMWVKLYHGSKIVLFFICESVTSELKKIIEVLEATISGDVFAKSKIIAIIPDITTKDNLTDELHFVLNDLKNRHPHIKYVNSCELTKLKILSIIAENIQSTNIFRDKFHLGESKVKELRRGWSS